jgi:hypothetical protein
MAFLHAVAELWIVSSAQKCPPRRARLREATKPSPASPISIIAQVEGSGTESASVQPMADRLAYQAENLTAL